MRVRMIRVFLPGWLLVQLCASAPTSAAPRAVTLADAVKAADATTTRALLQQGADVNMPGVDGMTALHWAAYRDDGETIDLLLHAGASVSAMSRYGVTPLAVACTNGAGASSIERLLEAGADPNTTKPGGETVLMTASRIGQSEVVKLLLARGATIEAREATRGQTALMWAAAEGHADTIRVLIEGGADVRTRSATLTPEQIENTAGRFLYTRPVPRLDTFTPLLFAVRAGHIEAARALLDGGADVNDMAPDGMSALVLAIVNAHYELASLLIDRGADPSAAKQGWNALHQVARTRTLNIGVFPHPEPTGRVSSLELAGRLIAKGVDVNARTTKPIVDSYRSPPPVSSTAFLFAAKGGDAEMMRFLVANGADPLITTDRGTSALMFAAGINMMLPDFDSGTDADGLACLKLALALGNDAKAVNTDGENALHGAANRGSTDIIQLLVDLGVDPNAKNRRGMTPLMIANGEANFMSLRPGAVTLLRQVLVDRGLTPEMKSAGEKLDRLDADENRPVKEDARPARRPQNGRNVG